MSYYPNKQKELVDKNGKAGTESDDDENDNENNNEPLYEEDDAPPDDDDSGDEGVIEAAGNGTNAIPI